MFNAILYDTSSWTTIRKISEIIYMYTCIYSARITTIQFRLLCKNRDLNVDLKILQEKNRFDVCDNDA